MYDRIFRLWYYTVSHGQMLLRSEGKDGEDNIDVYFGAVMYIELPVRMNGIEIIKTTQEDIDYIAKRVGNADEMIITVLMSENQKYYVVSSIVRTSQNKLGRFELPFDIPNNMESAYHHSGDSV